MHYLAFSLGHKLHSSILLIYFVCMKQIELLHASRSRLTEISLLHDVMQRTSLLSTLIWSRREVVSTANVCKLSGGLCKAYLIFLLKHFKYSHTFPPRDT